MPFKHPEDPALIAMNIIIFNSHLLPASQTFVRDPAEKLKRFTPYYIGSRRIRGLALPEDRTWVVNQGGLSGALKESHFKLLGYSPSLYQIIKKINPELIHAQFGLSGALILPIMRSLNIPLIVHYRGADATSTKSSSQYASLNHWLYFKRLETLKHKTTLFLAVSKFIKQKLIDQGFPADKILHHYHGVDLQRFDPDASLPRESVVLFVGRLTEKKGVENLIKAMAIVQTRLPDVKLVIIGDGPLRHQLEMLAANEVHHCQFYGVQSPETVKQWMNRSCLLVAPSLTAANGDSEGLPNVVLEAQAMQLPVISTTHAGIPEAVIHGKTGFLVPERDYKQLAEYCLTLLTTPEYWRSMSLQARKHMETNFDREKQTQRLEEIYMSVLP
jgi:glycosyltransferase involved in cell wall biosynthesis